MSDSALSWVGPACRHGLELDTQRLRCPECGTSHRLREGIWRFAPDLEPSGFPASRREHLEELEAGHFWFPPRRRPVEGILDQAAVAGSGGLELGCGTGSFLPALLRRFETVVGLDAFEASLQRARQRAPEAILIQGDAARVPLGDGQFTLVVALDVLEHMEPADLLGEAGRLVRPGGWLLLTVPACPGLWSDLDRDAGHRVRYTFKGLAGELGDHGWEVVASTHYQALLLPLVWISRRMPRRAFHRLERRPPRLVGALFGAINSLEVALFKGIRLPWGSSLVVLGRHRGATPPGAAS